MMSVIGSGLWRSSFLFASASQRANERSGQRKTGQVRTGRDRSGQTSMCSLTKQYSMVRVALPSQHCHWWFSSSVVR